MYDVANTDTLIVYKEAEEPQALLEQEKRNRSEV
jgi:hypothetical protein